MSLSRIDSNIGYICSISEYCFMSTPFYILRLTDQSTTYIFAAIFTLVPCVLAFSTESSFIFSGTTAVTSGELSKCRGEERDLRLNKCVGERKTLMMNIPDSPRLTRKSLETIAVLYGCDSAIYRPKLSV
ncbi:uncharacterized protein LOC131535470 isoform X3 [Onychostoma macrolepis]|uniref:uncharacterized protein LOC131535470 isoform X3 n=1 Tax=Onychostoma macrolepis TaxID=369639 RepID=UPI00272A85D1|nr:uncharacterized protein LOC131535470 isoform X3 [Onychostoma macrolepis]